MNFRNIILKQDQGTWFMTGPTDEGMIRTDHIQSLAGLVLQV